MERVRAACIAMAAWLAMAVLQVAPASAQSRVFVAAQGSDGNPCTFALPCRTFQHAHDVLVAGGEIDVLDPAGYGALIITKSISIQGHGFAGISAPNGNAITVNAGVSDKVSLRGLLIDGVGGGTNGIQFNTGASLNLQDSLIRNFSGFSNAVTNGLLFQPNASTRLAVSNTLIADNVGSAITVTPSGSGTVIGVLNRVETENNHGNGLTVNATTNGTTSTGSIHFTISDSVFSEGIGASGVAAVSNSGNAATTVIVRNSTVAGNGNNGLFVSGGAATLLIARSTITGNGLAWGTSNSGTLLSYGDNDIDANTNGNTAPPSTPHR